MKCERCKSDFRTAGNNINCANCGRPCCPKCLTSFGSRGDSYDNALAESVIGLFTTEVIRRTGPWRTIETVEVATLTWVDWFNHRRLLGPIGFVPPAEYEARYYEQAAVA